MRLALVLLCAMGNAATAAPAPPVTSPEIKDMSVGVLCSPRVAELVAAPNTTLGYTGRVEKAPKIGFAQQVVPATLGVSFGVTFTAAHALVGVRNLTYRPDKSTPDVYYSDILAKPGRYRGFGFETPEEMIPGMWRLESWAGDQLLYSVEFEVVPEAAAPEIQAQCQGMS